MCGAHTEPDRFIADACVRACEPGDKHGRDRRTHHHMQHKNTPHTFRTRALESLPSLSCALAVRVNVCRSKVSARPPRWGLRGRIVCRVCICAWAGNKIPREWNTLNWPNARARALAYTITEPGTRRCVRMCLYCERSRSLWRARARASLTFARDRRRARQML